MDSQGNAYVVGTTGSDESTFPVNIGPDLTFNGIFDTFITKIKNTPFTLVVYPDPLVSGQSVTFDVTNGKPYENTWLAYSLIGTGNTPVPALNIKVGLTNPIKAAGPKLTNIQGNVSWVLMVPPGTSGINIWFQAVQYNYATNVVSTSIQ